MRVEQGIIQDKQIADIEFKLHIVKPSGKANVRTLKQMKAIKGLTIHNTANTNVSADDEAHAKYLQNVENADSLYVSWHFTVDHDSITQHLPLTEQGYHAGDGSGEGNSSTIAIEIAENKDYEIAEQNAIKLIVELMKHYNISIENVLPHRFFAKNKKLCPRRILRSEATWKQDWKKFQERVMVVYNKKEEVKQEVGQVVYNSIEEVPVWYRQSVKKLVDKGILTGNSKGDLGLSEDMCRIFTIHDRMGLYQ